MKIPDEHIITWRGREWLVTATAEGVLLTQQQMVIDFYGKLGTREWHIWPRMDLIEERLLCYVDTPIHEDYDRMSL